MSTVGHVNPLADILGIDLSDPQQALAADLVEADRELLQDLVRLRKELDLRQQDVADRLGVSQPTVQAFERLGNDPRLSTIRRYALAIGAVVTHTVRPDDRLARLMTRQRDLPDEEAPAGEALLLRQYRAASAATA